MNVLIVEDSPAKAEAITKLLTKSITNEITCVGNLSEAVRALSQQTFDLIVLDLMVPYLTDGAADRLAGLELLRQIRSDDSQNVASSVIGLSAFPDELAVSRPEFEKYGVLICTYDDSEGWKETLTRIADDAARRRSQREPIDFLLFVALEEEKRGFENIDFDWGLEETIANLNIHRVTIKESGARGAIIKLREMGLVAATLDASIALARFSPQIVCMSGICAGFSDNVQLGQLVVGSPAWEYQAGKWSENGFEIGGYQIPLRPATRVKIQQVVDSTKFIDYLENGINRSVTRPSKLANTILAPAVTGSAVIADKARLDHIEPQHRKIAALDMETFGIYYAAHECDFYVPHFFSVKCVVDLADKEKGDDFHDYGCVVAAKAARSFIGTLLPSSRLVPKT